MKITEPFTWFDLSKLHQDHSYLPALSLQLKFSDTIKLSEVLKDCTNILLEKRDGIKNYNNKRKRHIDSDSLSTLPGLSKKIKHLCQANSIDWCVEQVGFSLPSIKFPFEIDLLDLMSIHVLNGLDEAISEPVSNQSSSNVMPSLQQALYCWKRLQDKKAAWDSSEQMVAGLIQLAKKTNQINQSHAGLLTAAMNRISAATDDLYIANIFLYLLHDQKNFTKEWHSLHELTNHFVEKISMNLNQYPLKKQLEIDSVSQERLKGVIKEINHFDKSLLIRSDNSEMKKITTKPIPEIMDEDSRWLHFKIGKKHGDNFDAPQLFIEAYQ